MQKRTGVVTALILCFPFIAVGSIAFAWRVVDEGWIVDRHGVPLAVDFVTFWVAGKFAHDGHAQLAYDWPATLAAQSALTHIPRGFPFNYPPHLLLALIPLSRLPYAVAFASFILVTGGLYVWSVVAISGRREAAVFALAMPGFVSALIAGQTACLAAALAGFTLLAAERRPYMSGLALGALTFKPQFGPLFPVALALERRWAVLAVASGATVTAFGASLWLLGAGVFAGFFAALQLDLDYGLNRGADDLARLQSAYGAARFVGLNISVAWAAQIGTMAVCVGSVMLTHWRCRSQNLRNAALLAGAALFTPHILVYDLVIIAPAVAFLWRDQALRPAEWYLLAAATLATYIVLFVPLPIGVLLPLTTLGLTLARVAARAKNSLGTKGPGMPGAPFNSAPECAPAAQHPPLVGAPAVESNERHLHSGFSSVL